jgi:hypothetical protein
MGSFSPAIDGSSVVLLGRFNPAIFQPAWLAAHSLIRQEEADHAKGLVFAPEVASFTVDWLRLQVTADRFEASTEDAAHSDVLRDLVASIFTLLEHTPFEKMGLNRFIHYRMESDERWHRFGDLLAPKFAWKVMLSKPGLRSLTMEGTRAEAPDARIQVKVEPSSRVHPGIFFNTNEHYEFSGADAGRRLIATMATSWRAAQDYARSVAEHLLAQEH